MCALGSFRHVFLKQKPFLSHGKLLLKRGEFSKGVCDIAGGGVSCPKKQ